MNEREMLFRKLQEYSFALYDTALFLNNNPTNREALAYYRKNLALYKEANERYTKTYGPLTHSDYDGGARWNWMSNPWPWHNTEEV